MRKILFRAKAINRDPDREYRTNYKNGDWVYGLVSKLYDEDFYEVFPHIPAEMTNEDGVSGIDIDYKTIGQYTNLNDKNGNKIFEGDIVKHYCGGPVGTDKGIIKWDQGRCCFYRTSFEYKDVYLGEKCVYEIIGNIYDNPELIGGKE